MKLNITDVPNPQDEEYVIDSLWAHNDKYDKVDIHPLFLTITDEDNKIVAGLVARTWWGGLEVQYLWVSDDFRKQGYGRELMLKAEAEAINRGCHMAYVDTFSFQAQEFYEKLGYRVYGELGEYAHKHTRYYLAKNL
ncbi:GNAT family N-acetyltransferase [Yersinia nurmii]|uniref:Acetyltransferase n=1 Tax=Yersinia nurmii TaxID=685706 RepID=A0AAW7JTX0_9GAMM|nr:GNAT family N-acetyltransferase [Yersinia nurmii]MDN0086203.1 GNAT family N-acetyltransferase [Yersinia nurmii]CNE46041.1 putative acetyltransferase [Yersinia nurmii]